MILLIMIPILVGLIMFALWSANKEIQAYDAYREARLKYIFGDYLVESCDRCRPPVKSEPSLRIIK